MVADQATHSFAIEIDAPRVPLPMKPLRVLRLVTLMLLTMSLLMPQPGP